MATVANRHARFAPVSTKVDFVEQEHRILELWEREHAFEKLVERNRGRPRFSFIDGPITANAETMGIHHAWARTYKDVFQRYKAMRGCDQRYQNGFDCHGLWVEVEVERELALNSKRDIEKFGVDRFSEACRARVDRSTAAFTRQSIRLGQWMHWDNSYYTYTDLNISHIWHVLKVCHERGWLYQGHRSMPWCARCGTALSQHELALGYREMTHDAVYVRFPIEGRGDRESFLVWTTTPWTLAANVALAVHPDLDYARVRFGDEVLILSGGTVASALKGKGEVLSTLKGRDLVGLRFSGPFDHLPAAAEAKPAHRVIEWDAVGETEGTGIVHIAPGCGAEDFALSKSEKLPVLVPIDDMARYRSGYAWLEGRDARDVADDIARDLRRKGLLVRAEPYTHRYPECWRCHEELVFRVDDEWFISMEELRPKLIAAARAVQWVPPHAGPRMENWLENMGDWNISRRRYWGLPLPFYTCAHGHFFVIGSEEELRQRARSGLEELRELHRPWIDRVVVGCPTCGKDSSRTKEVGDCWLDAGIVPFSTLDWLHDRAYWEKWFPADYVVEMVEQVRLWFYSLLFFSVVLTERAPYRVVMTFEPMMDASGEEFHKTGENVVLLPEVMEQYGADLIRWTVARARLDDTLYFSSSLLEDVRRRLLTFWNTYAGFFIPYANLDGFDPAAPAPERSRRPALDRWILSRLHRLVRDATADLERWDAQGVALGVERFWDELSTWYVRRSRRRFWKSGDDADKRAAEHTLFEVLTTLARLMAPFMPFLSEAMHQNLVRNVVGAAPASVHHTEWPVADERLIDDTLERAMTIARRVVSAGSAARHAANVKVRMPLAMLIAVVPDAEERRLASANVDLIKDELNVKAVELVDKLDRYVDVLVKPDLRVLGPKLGKDLPKAQAALREAKLEADGSVAAGEFRFSANEVLVERKAKAPYALGGEPPYLALVDAMRTPELEAEGLARELIHTVQNLRKEKGFEIADRIVLRYDGEIRDVVEKFKDDIASEVLAVRIVGGTSDDAWRGTLNGMPAALEVEKA